MTKAIVAIQHSVRHSRAFGSYMLVFAAAFLMLYVSSIFSIVKNTAIRQQAEAESTRLSSVVGDLEFSYIALKGSISPESVSVAGLSPVTELSYVSRASLQTALAIPTSRAQ